MFHLTVSHYKGDRQKEILAAISEFEYFREPITRNETSTVLTIYYNDFDSRKSKQP